MNKFKKYRFNKNLKMKLCTIGLIGTMAITFSGCYTPELAPIEDYDSITQSDSQNSNIESGLTQTLDIPGETFKLVTNYSCDDTSKRAWRITSDKFLYLDVCTKNLPEDTKVYIDNIHIDTSIKSKYAVMDGILQDSMDDRIHNTEMIGFPISNDIKYYGVNAIEGCNQDFISGSFYGFNGYSSGEVEQRRYKESDYIDGGVYANKIQVVYDLLVLGPNDETPRNISVCTDYLIYISNEIQYEENGKTKVLK